MYDSIDPLGSDEVRRALAFARARERYAGTRRDDLLTCCEAAWEAAVTSGAEGDPIDRFDRSLKLIAWTRGWTRGPVDLSDLRGETIPMSVLRPFMLPGTARDSLEQAAGPPRPLPAHARSSRPRFPRLPFLSPIPMASALAASMIGIAVMGQSGALPSLSVDPSDAGAAAGDDGGPGGSALIPMDGVQAGGSGAASSHGSPGGAWGADGDGSHIAGVASDMPSAAARGESGGSGGGPMPDIALAPPAANAPPVPGAAPSTPIRTVGPAAPAPPLPPIKADPGIRLPHLPPVVEEVAAPIAGGGDQESVDGQQGDVGQQEEQPPTQSLADYLEQLRQNLAQESPAPVPDVPDVVTAPGQEQQDPPTTPEQPAAPEQPPAPVQPATPQAPAAPQRTAAPRQRTAAPKPAPAAPKAPPVKPAAAPAPAAPAPAPPQPPAPPVQQKAPAAPAPAAPATPPTPAAPAPPAA